ncbi:MAG: hypothetical protein JWO42_2836 [Chloroflexi bacterium]|nr:hypothetical protein [Chloroflexota bacterium]
MHLAPNIFLAEINGQGVLLDLSADRYLGLAPQLTRAALALTGQWDAGLDPEILAAARAKLLAKGYLTEAPMGDRPQPIPFNSSWWPNRPGAGSSPHPRLPLAALASLAGVAVGLRTRAFASLISSLRARKAGRPPQPRASMQELLDAYFAARPLFPIKPICRLDAPALCALLWRHGHDAELVFGVRLNPFAAHCWAQAHSAILNEPHDALRQYTPIMTV